MIEVSAVCDECNKRVPVVRMRFTETGYVLLDLECGHQTGFAFTEKLVKMITSKDDELAKMEKSKNVAKGT